MIENESTLNKRKLNDWTIEWQWTWNTERFSGRILASRVYSLEAFLILSLESSLPARNFLPLSPHKSSLVPTFCATFMIDIECLVLDCLKYETRLDRARERNIPQGIEVLGSVLADSAPLASYNLCPIEVYSELSYFWSTVTTF